MNNFPVKTTSSEWMATYPAEIMVCDQAGIILEMNNVAIRMYEKEGGAKLIGRMSLITTRSLPETTSGSWSSRERMLFTRLRRLA